MNKSHTYLWTIILILSLSLNTYAAEKPDSLIKRGYTKTGIYYEVHGKISLSQRADNITVTRQVTYDGKINPEKQILWTESIDGITCTGILSLVQHTYMGNKTVAVYKGTLTAQT